MSPLEQTPLWLIPYGLLMLFMVHAMVQFVLSLMVKRPPPRKRPVPATQLRQRLFALNGPEYPYRLVEGRDWDIELQWEIFDASWRRRFARVRVSSLYRARLLLDEAHREVRLQEHMRTGHLFLGFDGWVPRFQWGWSAFWGPMRGVWAGCVYGLSDGFPPQIVERSSFSFNTDDVKEQIGHTANAAGWALRPVILPYQISRRWQQRLQAITPGPLLRLPDRAFWGLMYPGSYLAGMVYLLLIGGRELRTPANLALMGAISVAWWGVWALLTWLLLGTPALRGRRR